MFTEFNFQVESDFVYLNGPKNEVLDHLNQFIDLMLNDVFPMLLTQLKNADDARLLQKATSERDILPEGK